MPLKFGYFAIPAAFSGQSTHDSRVPISANASIP